MPINQIIHTGRIVRVQKKQIEAAEAQLSFSAMPAQPERGGICEDGLSHDGKIFLKRKRRIFVSEKSTKIQKCHRTKPLRWN